MVERVGRQRDAAVGSERPGEAALLVVERPTDDGRDVVVGEGLEPPDAHPRQERGVDLEVRILGRRPDERDRAILDVGKQGVLLGLVEAVDLVEEQDRAAARAGRAAPGPRRSGRGRRATPAMTADRVAKWAPISPASSRARLVLPVPGGPQKISDARWPRAMLRRSGPRSPTRCSWPTNSSRLRGRMRAARGWRSGGGWKSASGRAPVVPRRVGTEPV